MKQRLIGAAVLVALAMIFLPMLLRGPDTAEPDAAQVSLDRPAAPDQEFETREVPLTLPTPRAPDQGVLGLDTGPRSADDPNAVATVDPSGAPAARTDFEPGAESDDGTLTSVDAATGLAEVPAVPVAPVAPPVTVPAPGPGNPVTAASPTPSPVPSAASVAGGGYVVNVGSFSNLANARALADKLRSRGLPITSESVDVSGKPAMRLRVGPYGDRAAAEAARLRVEGVTGGAANVAALEGSAAPAPARAAATAPAAPTPAPRASTAAGVGFAVQLGAFSNEADASKLRDRARAAGFTAFHQRVDTDRGAVWRVRVGPEADRAGADRLRESVTAKLGMKDVIVVSHP